MGPWAQMPMDVASDVDVLAHSVDEDYGGFFPLTTALRPPWHSSFMITYP